MASSTAAGQLVSIRAGGTKQDWGPPLAPAPDLVVDTTGLDALVAHNAGDLTAVVGAGMALSRLQERLAGAGQWLALDPPSQPRGATVGGLLATGEAGPRRHRYGSLRDLVIGVTMVLPDGTVARSGGQVIKNVAGYDLAKLLCGSQGTLALVTEVSLRLHPLDAHSATVRIPATPTEATPLVVGLLAAPVVASALDWAGGALWVRIEGSAGGVRSQVEEVRSLAAEGSAPSAVLEGEEEARAWEELARIEAGEEGDTLAVATSLPSQLAEVAEASDRAAGEVGVAADLVSRAGLGLHTARLRAEDLGAHAGFISAWRRAVQRLGGTVVVRRHPPGLEEVADLLGPPPSAVEVMGRVKDQMDPGHRLGRGRFSPWWL